LELNNRAIDHKPQFFVWEPKEDVNLELRFVTWTPSKPKRNQIDKKSFWIFEWDLTKLNFEINEKMYTMRFDFEHEPILSATKPTFYGSTTHLLRYKDENYIYLLLYYFLLYYELFQQF
jgi:hypothetical protein